MPKKIINAVDFDTVQEAERAIINEQRKHQTDCHDTGPSLTPAILDNFLHRY